MGNQFYFSIYNSATGVYYTKPMRTKDHALNTFQKFIWQAEYQSRKKFKHLYTNFGKEFANKTFKEYKTKEGIKWKPSASYTLKQNKKAEPLNYTLMFLVQCILAAINLPKMFWDKLIKTAVYFRNWIPGINNITSYELSNYFYLDFSHLKVVSF